MTKADVDAIVIGGGAVGLACALALAQSGRPTTLLEKRNRLGEETSTHNSGVIHAGIYYPASSLKARLCVRGRRLLAETLPKWGVNHRFDGKLIVATTPEEIPALEALLEKGRTNGVESLELITARQARAIEPNIQPLAALRSPGTGVFDAAEYIKALDAHASAAGANILIDSEVVDIEQKNNGITIHTRQRGSITAGFVVNAAGLYADRIAALCGDNRHRIYPCRGEYAVATPKAAKLINALVYPVPKKISLGVHLTKTVHGELLIGPDAKYIDDRTDYESDRRDPLDFLPEAKALCPALSAKDLRLGQTGIRPKRYGPGEDAKDFFIEGQTDDPRIVHLVGIESPGLTASLAIGRKIKRMADDAL